jgi:hypothetical protein
LRERKFGSILVALGKPATYQIALLVAVQGSLRKLLKDMLVETAMLAEIYIEALLVDEELAD